MSAARALARLALLGLGLLLPACGTPRPPDLAPQQIPTPDPDEIDRVLFLVGDGGETRWETHPILRRLERDVEEWAARLPGDSAVAMLMLGDNVYPLGLHPPGSEEYPGDSAIVMSQVRVVAGPAARAAGVVQYFLAGNHDVGLKADWEGFVRLHTLNDFLEMARLTTGAETHLVPPPGEGGPFVLDWGPSIRMVLLDTQWWILQADDASKAQLLADVEEAVSTAGDRHVLIAAHHPFKTAGPHGGNFSFWNTLGLQYLLYRSGAILQDISSVPYRGLESGLRDIFARHGQPLAFIGGHEHSLQIIGATRPTDPRHMLVSGSVSKTSLVGPLEGLRFARGVHGYMRLVVERDGDVGVYVEAAPEGSLICPAEGPEHAPCMESGVASFETVHSEYLR